MRAAILLISLFPNIAAFAQQCPHLDPKGPDVLSESRQLSGRLLYHDGLRQWFELKLDAPTCEQTSLQMTEMKDDWKDMQVVRGCHVRSEGTLGDAGTGYYSLPVYQDVSKIVPDDACIQRLPFPDYSHLKPNPQIRHYTVEMDVNYRGGDHPVVFKITSAGRSLHPWQAYASCDLTGLFVLYGHCAKNFEVRKVFGTHAARPQFFSVEEPATFAPESAAAVGVKDLRLGYSCVRSK